MQNILFLFVLISFALNLSCPSELSSASPILLIIEFVGVLIVSKEINTRILCRCDQRIRRRIWKVNLLYITFALLYLHFCWTPYLSESSHIWGFDPQRYYLYSSSFAKGYELEFGLNYMGVVIFYEYLFKIFGIDPLIPLYLNILLVNIAACYLVRIFLYRFNVTSFSRKYLPLLILLPEVIFYSVMSSREILCMTFCTIAFCAFCDYNKSKNRRWIYLIGGIIAFMFSIRPPMAIGIIISLFGSMLINSKKSSFYKLSLIACLSAIMIFVLYRFPMFSELASAAQDVINGKGAESDQFVYSSGSIAKLLTPSNPIQFVIFGIVRSFLYLIPKTPPLSILTFDEAYFFGDAVLVYLTSCIFVFVLPAITILAINYRRLPDFCRTLFVFFVVFFLLVGAFNSSIIQDRYRVVYDFFAVILIFCSIESFGIGLYKQMLYKILFAMFLLLSLILVVVLV